MRCHTFLTIKQGPKNEDSSYNVPVLYMNIANCSGGLEYHFLLFWKVCSNEVSRASLAASSNTCPHKALLTQPSL
jgi:hypothetical protein